ncbi:uncharacterized protein LOC135928293 isoform X5 [Gordionus sp. m RMFG-2023]|uniref:uncharacterized protein LOC135928293 isoform X5 n=1 Tax=Gordionus sp. m RMFG-2023 TaxID=3053472 RepID=UPI0031FC11A8
MYKFLSLLSAIYLISVCIKRLEANNEVSNMTICAVFNYTCEYRIIDDDIVRTREENLYSSKEHIITNPNVIICRCDKMLINFSCEIEGNGIIYVLAADIFSYIQTYLTYIDHYIQISNLLIGIRIGNENLTFNLEQEFKPKVNTIGSMLNSTTSVKLIEDVNGTLIISLGLVKRFRGPVSELINITSYDSRPYLIKHYDVDIMKDVSNMTVCTENNLTCEYRVIDDDIVKTRKVQLKENEKNEHFHLRDLTIIATNFGMGIFLENKILTLNIEQEKRPKALAITLYKPPTNYNKWRDSTPALAKKITAITWLKKINGTLTIYLGRTEIFRKHVTHEMEILSRNSPSYFIQHNGIQWLKVGKTMNQDPNLMICGRAKNGFIKNITAENVISYIQKYLNHTDHYIQTSNLVIGIRLRNENLSLSIEQKTKPKVNTTGVMFNSKDVNGTLIISLGLVRRYRGQVSESINITSSKGSRPYLIKHNAPNVIISRRAKMIQNFSCENEGGDILNIKEENVTSFIQTYLTYIDHYIQTNLDIGIRLRNKTLILIIEQETIPKVNSTTESIINSTTFQKRIEDVNGTLIITLGRDKIFHGSVNKSIRITFSRVFRRFTISCQA